MMFGQAPMMGTRCSSGADRDEHLVAAINPDLDREYRGSGEWSDAGLYGRWRAALVAVPDGEAVVDSRGVRASYAEVDTDAARLAGYLAEAGIRAGDVLTVVMPNRAEFLTVYIACLKLGVIINPSLPQLRFSELHDQTGRCRTAAMIILTRFRSIDHAADAHRLTSSCPALRTVLTIGEPVLGGPFVGFEDALRHDPLPEHLCTPGGGNDVAAVLFTSGSEARPKGVMLTHNNILAGERGFIRALAIAQGVRMFMPAPVAHATGFLHGIAMPMMQQGCCILLDSFTGDRAARMMNSERATSTMGSTTIITELLDAAEKIGGLHHGLRRICCGGAPVPRALVERALRMGVVVHSIYGSTESAPHTATRPDDSLDRVVHTDGRAVPGTEVRIVDPVTRRSLPPGVEGEEASRGPAVFSGYVNDPELTATVLDAEGWYYSGDLAVMDAAGYIRVTGRIKDTILRGGENISAREVEELLLQDPSVAQAAVVAMPDERLGECVCAFVVMRGDAERITLEGVRALFGMLEVARFKTPERVEVIDAMPLTPTGKVRKVELRERLGRLMAAEAAVGVERS
jgi:acyl-CoA synthetase